MSLRLESDNKEKQKCKNEKCKNFTEKIYCCAGCKQRVYREKVKGKKLRGYIAWGSWRPQREDKSVTASGL